MYVIKSFWGISYVRTVLVCNVSETVLCTLSGTDLHSWRLVYHLNTLQTAYIFMQIENVVVLLITSPLETGTLSHSGDRDTLPLSKCWIPTPSSHGCSPEVTHHSNTFNTWVAVYQSYTVCTNICYLVRKKWKGGGGKAVSVTCHRSPRGGRTEVPTFSRQSVQRGCQPYVSATPPPKEDSR